MPSRRLFVKLDENLGTSHVRWLSRHGYRVQRIHEQGLSGQPDDRVWRKICEERAFFITLDLDFSDIRRFPPARHPGILLLRPKSRGRRAVQKVLLRVVTKTPLEELIGCLAVADGLRTRIRRPRTPK
jgi:predicted nuclease of predicted toxin-antitoxin system